MSNENDTTPVIFGSENLNPTQLSILGILMSKVPNGVGVDDISSQIGFTKGSTHTTISRLRKKLKDNYWLAKKHVVLTLFGMYYYFDLQNLNPEQYAVFLRPELRVGIVAKYEDVFINCDQVRQPILSKYELTLLFLRYFRSVYSPNHLPAKSRYLLALLNFEPLTTEQIAELLAIEALTVTNHIRQIETILYWYHQEYSIGLSLRQQVQKKSNLYQLITSV